MLNHLRQDLKKQADLKYKQGAENFFKEKIYCYGVRTPVVRKISSKHFPKVKPREKEDVLKLAGAMMKTNIFEECITALDWAYRIKKQYQRKDFNIFESWLKKYVTNWAVCDIFCGRTLGWSVFEYPELIKKVEKWRKSKNRWVRRASAVIFIYPIRKGKYLKEVFQTADALLLDTDDMVQKGYGWMLKVASDKFQKQVFDYVMKNKDRMPRTALRYAIEKMPVSLKKKAMA